MSRFIVAVFPDLAGAEAGIGTLKALASESIIRLHGAATVTRDDNGKLVMDVVADDAPGLAAAGALIGGLAGLALGPMAAAILAAGGAVFGVSAGLTNRDSGTALAARMAADLPWDRAAVVAELSTEDPATLAARLEAVGGTLVRNETSPAT